MTPSLLERSVRQRRGLQRDLVLLLVAILLIRNGEQQTDLILLRTDIPDARAALSGPGERPPERAAVQRRRQRHRRHARRRARHQPGQGESVVPDDVSSQKAVTVNTECSCGFCCFFSYRVDHLSILVCIKLFTLKMQIEDK